MNRETEIYKLHDEERDEAYKTLPNKKRIVQRIENHIKVFKAIAKDVQLIVDEAQKKGIVICGGVGEDDPKIDQYGIWLNGDRSQNLDHETFCLELFDTGMFNTFEELKKPEIFGFCKTAHKPYDLVVCASLIALKHHLKSDFEISSDGSFQYGEWNEAIEFYEKLFKRKTPASLMKYLKGENQEV